MIWDAVMHDAVLPLLTDDADLVAALGGEHIYAAQASRPVRIPSVEWLLVSDVEEEVMNPLDVQFDYWARSTAEAAVIERRLRVLLTANTRRVLAGMDMATLYQDSFTQEYPVPGIVARSLRFRFEPLRRQALPVSP